MSFAQYLDENADVINAFLATYFEYEQDADVRNYLYDPLTDYLSNAGKRHRPIICMLACKAVGGDPRRALRSGAAIEQFHTAALIHDDIADGSLLRRGKPCMHLTEGEGIAINAGDMALSTVLSCVLDDDGLDDSTKVSVLGEIACMDTKTIEGQALDVGWARDNRYDLDVDDYVKMATLKTAYYSGGIPLAVGAIVGGGTPQQVESLREFGMLTGLAFQIQDDLLNLVGSVESTGKDYRNDITEGKRTLAVVHALGNSPRAAELRQLLDARTTDPQQLEQAVQIMMESGSIDYARSYALDLIERAKPLLDGIVDEQSRQTLLSMADYFIDRFN